MIISVILFLIMGAVGVSWGPVGRAFARRVGGEHQAGRDDEEMDALRGEVTELRRELDDVHNRLDFTERLLAQARERGLLGEPKER